MLFPIMSILAACLLYSIAIWSEQWRGGLSRRLVVLFGLAFLLDCLGTSTMILRVINGNLPLSIHSYSSIAALAIMLIHFEWAFGAHKTGGYASKRFNQLSPYAWCLWMVAFLSGIPAFSQSLWLILFIVWCLFSYLQVLTQRRNTDIRVTAALAVGMTDWYRNGNVMTFRQCVATGLLFILVPGFSFSWTLMLGCTGILVCLIRR